MDREKRDRREYNAKRYQANREASLLRTRQNYDRLRLEFIAAYGGKCSCCGESNPKFLTISHVNGDGAAHRASVSTTRGAGNAVIYDLRRRGWPQDEGVACECFNCNFGARHNGNVCPHKADGS